MKEVVTVQIGQCGNQSRDELILVGHEFWKQLCMEHSVAEDGQQDATSASKKSREDLFFSLSNSGHLIPRNIMVDLEHRVIDNIRSSTSYGTIYNCENIFVPSEGSGAGNNWAIGHASGQRNMDSLIELIDREVDNTDRLQVSV
jgi:tubulin gamma